MGALVYIRYMWLSRERLGLEGGAQRPVLKEVKKFLGAGAAVVFRQVYIRPYRFLAHPSNHVLGDTINSVSFPRIPKMFTS